MKLQSIYLLLVPALLSVSSCSDPEHSGFEQVPIELRASGNGEVDTKADGYQTIDQAFQTTIFASKRDGIPAYRRPMLTNGRKTQLCR